MRIASRSKSATPAWHQGFLALLPQICHYARFAFRHLKFEAKQEAIQCVVASALAAYVRLLQRGKANVAYATPLAMYAIRQYRDGRRLGSRLNVRDISSAYAQKMKNLTLKRLDKFNSEENCWEEVLIEDRTVGPADLAASRIDFPAWLRGLSCRDRRIAEFLAFGHRTSDTARKFRLSEGRVSQLRRELAESWRAFVGELPLPGPTGATA